MTADDFWMWFAGEQRTLLDVEGEEAASRIEEKLRSFDARIGVEVGDPGGDREVIFTAYSASEVFPAVKEFVSLAPALSGWRLTALKPPRGFGFTMNIEGLEIVASQISFQLLESEAMPGALALRFLVHPELASHADALAIVRLIVETGIGEEAAAKIVYMEAVPWTESAEDPLEISSLGEYVDWRTRAGAWQEPS